MLAWEPGGADCTGSEPASDRGNGWPTCGSGTGLCSEVVKTEVRCQRVLLGYDAWLEEDQAGGDLGGINSQKLVAGALAMRGFD